MDNTKLDFYNINIILDYLEGKLSAEDHHAFEQKMVTDTFLFRSVEGYRKALKKKGREEILAGVGNIKPPGNETKIIPLFKKIPFSIAAVFMGIILLVAGLIWWQQGKNGNGNEWVSLSIDTLKLKSDPDYFNFLLQTLENGNGNEPVAGGPSYNQKETPFFSLQKSKQKNEAWRLTLLPYDSAFKPSIFYWINDSKVMQMDASNSSILQIDPNRENTLTLLSPGYTTKQKKITGSDTLLYCWMFHQKELNLSNWQSALPKTSLILPPVALEKESGAVPKNGWEELYLLLLKQISYQANLQLQPTLVTLTFFPDSFTPLNVEYLGVDGKIPVNPIIQPDALLNLTKQIQWLPVAQNNFKIYWVMSL